MSRQTIYCSCISFHGLYRPRVMRSVDSIILFKPLEDGLSPLVSQFVYCFKTIYGVLGRRFSFSSLFVSRLATSANNRPSFSCFSRSLYANFSHSLSHQLYLRITLPLVLSTPIASTYHIREEQPIPTFLRNEALRRRHGIARCSALHDSILEGL